MKIWHISDTHDRHQELTIPDVDMVIHSGDATTASSPSENLEELQRFKTWWDQLPIKHKIFVPGNHDRSLTNPGIVAEFRATNTHLLLHEEVEIEGFRFFGSPWTPVFGRWSFMKGPDELKYLWYRTPDDANIWITHGPPKGIFDKSKDFETGEYDSFGDEALSKRIEEVKPIAHLFGHFHNDSVVTNYGVVEKDGTLFCNAAIVSHVRRAPIKNGHILELANASYNNGHSKSVT